MQKQFTDKYLNKSNQDITADAAEGGVENSNAFDTQGCISPSLNVHVSELDANKSLTLKLQDSDKSDEDFVDVPLGLKTDCDPKASVEETGVKKFFYAGQKRYFRLVVTSVEAAVGATVRVYYQQHHLLERPNNRSDV